MRNQYRKFQEDISFPKFTKRTITQKYHMIFFSIFTKYFSHHPLSADTSFNCLAFILFEIQHLQNFIPCFSKGVILQGEILWEENIVCYFSMRNPYMKCQAISGCPIHTYGQAETNMLPTGSSLTLKTGDLQMSPKFPFMRYIDVP